MVGFAKNLVCHIVMANRKEAIMPAKVEHKNLSHDEHIKLLQTHLDAPFKPKPDIQVRVVNTPDAAKRWVAKGYIPIECSAGESVVDDFFVMDHHGKFSELPGVALRAYDEFYGYLVHSPKVVFVGYPDEDATFAAASLLGLIPHPILEEVFAGEEMGALQHTIMCQNLLHVAETINEADTNIDKALELDSTQIGRLVLFWRMIGSYTMSDTLAWWGGISRWRDLLTRKDLRSVKGVATKLKDEIVDEVMSSKNARVSDRVVVVNFTDYGRNAALYRRFLTGSNIPIGVFWFGGDELACSIVVRDQEALSACFKNPERGLLDIYPMLQPGGAGGRPNIGGSSRSEKMTWEDAIVLGTQIDSYLKKIPVTTATS
jgi:hypothetical protein